MAAWVPVDAHPWERGAVHWVRSRNLVLAVFTGDTEWLGVREKFRTRYLATEPVDAVWLAVSARVPEEIRLTPTVGRPYCELCGTAALWTGPPAPAPWVCDDGCTEPRPTRLENRPLFEFLEDLRGLPDPGHDNARIAC